MQENHYQALSSLWCCVISVQLQEEENEEKHDLDDEDDEMIFDEDFDAEDEAEEEDDGLEEDEEGEEVKESAKMKVLRIVAGLASKMKEIIGNLITTAGKVVVTILLGLTGKKCWQHEIDAFKKSLLPKLTTVQISSQRNSR